ncbi:MAG: hypothetical protein B6229_07570 [Spirochaetaceae bacterium 4572_7]|nr:MAG: hypothetical protein B6229_07570 [Spirochaetaceae bacterium 4572_7]
MKKVLLVIVIISVSCCLDKGGRGHNVKVMSWNVQNLFDGVDNGVEYSEFSVEKGYWSEELYLKRLKLLSKVILLNNPDIVALQEIESLKVLEDFREKYLKDYKYITSTNSSGAIQLGFMSKYPISRVSYIDPNNKSSKLRYLLEVEFLIGDNKLIVINNHWKSKYGGGSENLRLLSSIALKKRIKELSGQDLLIVGDLNESYNEYQKVNKSYTTALLFNEDGLGITLKNKGSIGFDELYTPWPDSDFSGSYNYRGEWETIDNILINHELYNSDGFSYGSFYVDSRSMLLNNYGTPYRWDVQAQGGFSDHLPVVVLLETSSIKTNWE